MKVSSLALNTIEKENIINTRTIQNHHHKKMKFHFSSNNDYTHYKRKDNEKKKSNIFKNNALLKSLSIDTNDDFKPIKRDSHNYTLTPNIKIYKSYYSYKRRPKKFFKLITNFNDEKFFSTAKNERKFLFPKENYIIKNSRINHDINFFNIRHVITDHTKQYEMNAYKIKKIVNQDIFINKIKNDLLRMKFGNRIKLFNKI